MRKFCSTKSSSGKRVWKDISENLNQAIAADANSSISIATTVTSSSSGSIKAAACSRASGSALEVDSETLASVLWAAGTLRTKSDIQNIALSNLGPFLEKINNDSWQANDLVRVVWGLARLRGEGARSLLEGNLARLATNFVDDMSPSQLSKLAWAFASARAGSSILNAIGDSIVDRGDAGTFFYFLLRFNLI